MLFRDMKQQSNTLLAGSTSARKLTVTSACGKWERYTQHAGLKRYLPSGVFFAFLKINGKNRLESLETDVKTVALDKLAFKRKTWRKAPAGVGTVADGFARYETAQAASVDLAEPSKLYNRHCVARIKKTWPELPGMKADRITEAQMLDWAAKAQKLYSPQAFNNAVNVLRQILKLSGLHTDDNPAYKIERRGIPRKQLNLPTAEQFEKLVHEVEHSGAGQSKDCAAFVRFLAYSGTRTSEAHQAFWRDVNFDGGFITIHCAKRRVGSQELLTRDVPLVPAMVTFLKSELGRLKLAGVEVKPDDHICRVVECEKSLTRACKVVGCARLTHHSLRHLFATFCIEAGIDIPTVSRWLGHSDGGALAMKVYGHLRREHSLRMAQKVKFGLPVNTANSVEQHQDSCVN